MWCSKNKLAWGAALLAISQLCCDTAMSFTDSPCATEGIFCAANEECNECLAYLMSLTELNYNGECQVHTTMSASAF